MIVRVIASSQSAKIIDPSLTMKNPITTEEWCKPQEPKKIFSRRWVIAIVVAVIVIAMVILYVFRDSIFVCGNNNGAKGNNNGIKGNNNENLDNNNENLDNNNENLDNNNENLGNNNENLDNKNENLGHNNGAKGNNNGAKGNNNENLGNNNGAKGNNNGNLGNNNGAKGNNNENLGNKSGINETDLAAERDRFIKSVIAIDTRKAQELFTSEYMAKYKELKIKYENIINANPNQNQVKFSAYGSILRMIQCCLDVVCYLSQKNPVKVQSQPQLLLDLGIIWKCYFDLYSKLSMQSIPTTTEQNICVWMCQLSDEPNTKSSFPELQTQLEQLFKKNPDLKTDVDNAIKKEDENRWQQ